MDKLTCMATLIAVAETGSFTAAGQMLAIPKSRVSQRVTTLESALGVRLLQRTTRTLKFTEEGLAYLETCRAILQEIEDAEHALGNAHVEANGTLRVDALISVARYVLGPHLHKFQRQYPKIELKLTASDRFSHLLEAGIDCAIRGGVLEDSSVVAKELTRVYLGLYASPQYLSMYGPVESPNELDRHLALSWFSSASRPFAWQLMNDDEVCDVHPLAGMTFDDPDVAIQACLSGAGICPGAPFAVEHLVRDRKLVPVLPQWNFAPRSIHVVYLNRRHLPARTRVFIAWISQLIDNSPYMQMRPSDLASLPT